MLSLATLYVQSRRTSLKDPRAASVMLRGFPLLHFDHEGVTKDACADIVSIRHELSRLFEGYVHDDSCCTALPQMHCKLLYSSSVSNHDRNKSRYGNFDDEVMHQRVQLQSSLFCFEPAVLWLRRNWLELAMMKTLLTKASTVATSVVSHYFILA